MPFGELKAIPTYGSSGSFRKLSVRTGPLLCGRPVWAGTPEWVYSQPANSLGLSCVRLLQVEETKEFGTVLHVGGADLMDGTPIFDIKPYIPYGDSHPEAVGGFTDHARDFLLKVDFPNDLLNQVPSDKRQALLGVLSHDPRPSYQRDAERIYGLSFSDLNIRFQVMGNELHVLEVNHI